MTMTNLPKLLVPRNVSSQLPLRFKYGTDTAARRWANPDDHQKRQQRWMATEPPKTKESTIDVNEIAHFGKMSANWWDPNGRMSLLHQMNTVRVPFVRDGLINTGQTRDAATSSLLGLKIVDVGCGGGILTEALARLGASVTGVDASEELIKIARHHATLDSDVSRNVEYLNTTIEDVAAMKSEHFDAVVASEVIEHVVNPELFLKSCVEALKPNGSIFLTTFNKTFVSWLGGIVMAEQVLRMIPSGTHEWNKFIPPHELRRMLEGLGCKTKLIHGLLYNPIMHDWYWTASTALTYCLHAVKRE